MRKKSEVATAGMCLCLLVLFSFTSIASAADGQQVLGLSETAVQNS